MVGPPKSVPPQFTLFEWTSSSALDRVVSIASLALLVGKSELLDIQVEAVQPPQYVYKNTLFWDLRSEEVSC